MKCGIYWSRCLCKTIIFISNTYARILSVPLPSLLIMLSSSYLSLPAPPTVGNCIWWECILRRTCQRNSTAFYHTESRAGVTKDPTTQITQWSVLKVHAAPPRLNWSHSGSTYNSLSKTPSLMQAEIQEGSGLYVLSHLVVLFVAASSGSFPRFGACPLEQQLPRFSL